MLIDLSAVFRSENRLLQHLLKYIAMLVNAFVLISAREKSIQSSESALL